MQMKITRQNIDDDELTAALSEYIHSEHLAGEVISRLKKKENPIHREIIPEKYIRAIARKMNLDFKTIRARLFSNIDRLLNADAETKAFLGRVKENPFLNEGQIEELRTLIESTFKRSIGFNIALPQQWKKAGIELPEASFEDWITQSYVAGRLCSVLDNTNTYAEMLAAAAKMPLTRQDELIFQAAKANAARYITGYGRKLADIAEDVALKQHQAAINHVVQQYFSGDLKQTKYNGQGLSPAETDAVLSTDSPVMNIRELATELKNRFKAEDVGRDWDRVVESEIRYATNLGRLAEIQIEGGGGDIYVYYQVQPTACDYCKKLYLNEDGTPKLFKLSEILDSVERTGGMNVGKKASLIGKEGGWVPNAIAHPHCHCYPVRWQPEYGFIIPKGAENHDRGEAS